MPALNFERFGYRQQLESSEIWLGALVLASRRPYDYSVAINAATTWAKDFTVWLLFFFSLAGLLWAPLSCGAVPTSQDLVGFWDFDGSLADRAGEASRTKSDFTAHGNAEAVVQPRFVDQTIALGVSGKALALGMEAGDAAYLTAPLSPDVKLGASYTIEAWIFPTQLVEWNRLVLNWGAKEQYAYHFALHHGQVSLCHNQASGKFLFCEGGSVQPNRWQHVAAVAARNDTDPAQSTLKVFLNGKVVSTVIFDGTSHDSGTEPLVIGDSIGVASAASRYHGYLDDLAIWKRPLTDQEIAVHYTERAVALEKMEADQRAPLLAKLTAHGFDVIVFAERNPGRDIGGHYYANFGYSAVDTNYWMHGQDGARLCKLNVRTGQLTAILEDRAGGIRDPQVHYDGQRILFSYRKAGTHNYHLYEIRADGTGLRQITDGPWDDLEPAWLPDGGIVFCSSRCKRYVACWLAPVATLYRCNADGSDLRMLSSNSVTENTPAVLPDGRVLYTRWEYVNRDPVVFHHLWSMGPDGAGQQVYFGNQAPGGVFIDGQPIPGTRSIVFINSPGHGQNEHAGHVVIASEAGGPNAKWAVKQITSSSQFRDPYPISPSEFLVAQGSQLLLLNDAGQTSVIYNGPQMVHEPRPLLSRPREPVIPSSADLTQASATLFVQDVHAGRNMAGLKRGQIKKLLVMEDLPKPANYHGGGSTPIGNGGTSTLKRLLGTVPVEEDGSACFEVPPLRSIYVALLDEQDRSVKQMRSFVTLQPGETRSCVGCHDTRTQSPALSRELTAATHRAPSRIQPIASVPEIMDFPRDIQPILDRHCTKCHNPEDRKGGVVLTADRGPVYSLSYYELFLRLQIADNSQGSGHGAGRPLGNDPPFTTYSSASPLMKKIDGTHHDTKLTDAERTLVRLWIDTAAQYAGTYAAYGTGQIGGWWRLNENTREMADAWPSTPPAREAMERRCGACHAGTMPRHVTDVVNTDGYGDMESWERPLSRFSRHHIFNLTRPEKSLALLSPLARAAGGYAEGAPPPAKKIANSHVIPPPDVVHPVIFASKDDPDFQKILVHLQAAGARLDEIKRFDMPGFRPRAEYVREMKRFGVLPASFDDAKDPINAYETDRKYWESMWFRPVNPPPHPAAGEQAKVKGVKG